MITENKSLQLSRPERQLIENRFITINKIIYDEEIDVIKRYYMLASRGILNKTLLPLLDGDDVTNCVYHSKRSKNLKYCYLKSKKTDFSQAIIINKLKHLFPRLDFYNSINQHCLPIFAYGNGAEIKAHRGVEKTEDLKMYQEYVCVVLLHQPNVDFAGGRFYINPKAEASSDGKTVWNDNPEDRLYPNLKKGGAVIFHNPSLVHGVQGVTDGFRATVSVRSNTKLH